MDNLPTLLLVEDEPAIRLSLADALAEAGYLVLESGSGEEAIAELDAEAGIVGLVTDIRVGTGPSGWDVARHARRLQARLAVVYMTGDSAAEWTAEGVPNSVMVQKPFAVAQVVTAISTLLNAIDLSPSMPAPE